MKLRSRAVAAGLTAALTFSTCMPVAWAVPAASLEEASQRLETYGSELAALQDELAAKTSDLEMTSYHIGEKQAAIDATQEQLIVAKNVLAGRMRSSYKAGPSTLLQVLLGADSLDDIVSRIYYMDKVSSSDAQAIANVRNLEATLKTEKGELEQIRAEIKQLRTDMNDTLADQNDINEMTRVQLEAISDALMELQNQGKNPLALPEIGYTAIQKRREEEEKK